jgi:hypothetical protein
MRSLSTLGCLLALGGALACDDGSARGPDLVRGDADGARLVARTLTFPGGASVQVGWFDQELETPCDFELAADGRLRCLPAARQGTLGYSSPDCAASSKIMGVDQLCEGGPETLALVRRGDSCAREARVFRLGDLDTSGHFYYADQEGVCREITRSDRLSYHQAEEIPPNNMVIAEHTALGEGRLQRYVDAARDGAQRLTTEFRDTELDDDCVFTSADDGKLRCVPGETSLDKSFTATPDPSCVGEAVFLPACRQSSFALRRDPMTCDGRILVYELGDMIGAGRILYREIDGECVPVENPDVDDTVMRWVGAEVEPPALVDAELELVGDGRVRGRWARIEDDSMVFVDFWDTLLETTCSGLTLQDGSIVCAPTSMLDIASYFSDPACLDARSVAAADGVCPAEGAFIRTFDANPPACAELRFHAVGAEVEGDLFYLNGFTNECRAVGEAQRATLREIGEEIDPDFEAAEPGSSPASARSPRQG